MRIRRLAAALVLAGLVVPGLAEADQLCASSGCKTCLTRCTQSEGYCLSLGVGFGAKCDNLRESTCPMVCDAVTRGNRPAPPVPANNCSEHGRGMCKMYFPDDPLRFRQCVLLCRN